MLSPPMRHAELQRDGSAGACGIGEHVVCRISVGLGDAGEVAQHGLRDALCAAGPGPEEGCRGVAAGEAAVVAQRGPQVSDPGLAEAGFEEPDGGLVEEQPFGGEDVPADGFTDRLQDPEALLQPTVEGGGADADAVAGQSLRQPVDRQVILELRRHGVGKRGFRRQSVADQPVRRGRLRWRLLAAAGAAEHGTLDRDADVVGRNVVQPFSRLGANDLPLAAATWTDRLVGLEAAGDGRHFVADLPAAPGAPGGRPSLRGRRMRGGSGAASPSAASSLSAPSAASPLGARKRSSHSQSGHSGSASSAAFPASDPRRSDNEPKAIAAYRRAARTAFSNFD